MAKWTENTTLKFVEEYLRYEVLWNFRSPDYRNKQAKQEAINRIVAAMAIPNFGFKEANLKIKSIRSTYSQELKKIKSSAKSGSGLDDVHKSNLKWFEIMNSALKSVNIAEIRTTQNNTENVVQNYVQRNEDDNIMEQNQENMGENANEQNQENTENISEPEATVKLTHGPAARKIKLKDLNLLVDKLNNVKQGLNTPKNAKEHEFDLFANSVAGQLKAMPLIQALEAQQYIQNYLSQLRIQHLMDANRDYPYTPSPSNTRYSSTPSPSYLRYPNTPSPSASTNYMYPPSPIQPPNPTVTNTNMPSTSTVALVNQPSSPTHELPTTRPPTPQNTITIYSSTEQDILAQALASITESEDGEADNNDFN